MLLVTSTPVPAPILDYALELIPDVDTADARARLQLISADDDSARPLAEKLLARARPARPDRGRDSRARGRVHQPVQRRRGRAGDRAASRHPGLLSRRPLLRLRHEVRQPRDVRARRRRRTRSGPSASPTSMTSSARSARSAHSAQGSKQVVVKLNDSVYGEGNVVVPVERPLTRRRRRACSPPAAITCPPNTSRPSPATQGSSRRC